MFSRLDAERGTAERGKEDDTEEEEEVNGERLTLGQQSRLEGTVDRMKSGMAG